MSRYIDADALIESIKNTADLGGWIGEALYQIKQVAIKYIDSAPTIEPKRGEWIPCSERLPEERLIVLVSFEEIHGLPSIGITYCNNGKWEDALYREVTAWMPLPKPYREGE